MPLLWVMSSLQMPVSVYSLLFLSHVSFLQYYFHMHSGFCFTQQSNFLPSKFHFALTCYTIILGLSSSTFHIHNQYLPTHFLTSQSHIIMVFKWDSESERSLLLLTITKMQGPKATVWPAVAEELGHGLNASACRYRIDFYFRLLRLHDFRLSSCFI